LHPAEGRGPRVGAVGSSAQEIRTSALAGALALVSGAAAGVMAHMRIVLTGASGLVGSAFARTAAAAGHEVFGIVGRFGGTLPGLTEQVSVDLSDPEALRRHLDGWRPQAIVNCAAISEPAACDDDPEDSERLNVDLPATLARAARQRDVRLVHVSTEQVFAGDRPPYRTTDPVRPINRYGRQKVA